MSNKLDTMDKHKRTLLRQMVAGSSLFFLGLSLATGFYPQEAAKILGMDAEIVSTLSIVLALVALADFAVAFILFKPKDRV